MRRPSVLVDGELAGIAQLVEHFTCNEDVTGSTPVAGSSSKICAVCLELLRIFLLNFGLVRLGEVPEWLNGADCKSAGSAYGGSNPPLSTILRCS